MNVVSGDGSLELSHGPCTVIRVYVDCMSLCIGFSLSLLNQIKPVYFLKYFTIWLSFFKCLFQLLHIGWTFLPPTILIFFFKFLDLISFFNRTNRPCLTDIVNLLQNVVCCCFFSPLFNWVRAVIGWRLWHLHTCETGLQWRKGGVDDLSFFFPSVLNPQ